MNSFNNSPIPSSSIKSYAPLLAFFGTIIFLILILIVICVYWPSKPTQFLVKNNQTANYLVLKSDSATGSTYISCGGSMKEASVSWILVQSGMLMTLNNVNNNGFLNYSSATAGQLITCTTPIDTNKLFTEVNIPDTATSYFRNTQNSDLILVADTNSTVFKLDEALYLASYPSSPTFFPPQNAIFGFTKML